MQAATLTALGQPLLISSVPLPTLGTGEVLVDVVATGVLSYTAEVFSGQRRYPLALPIIPGCGAIGRVRAVGPDSTRLQAGQWVLCDPTVRSRDDALVPDIVLQGWSSRGEGGQRLMQFYHDGPFAQQMRLPTENAVPIGPLTDDEAARWCALLVCLVPYGGLRRAGLLAGETLLISGATGNYGSAAVAVALAMGVERVIATGRNAATLNSLTRRFGARVQTVQLTGNSLTDTEAMKAAAAPGRIDCVLDFLPPEVSATVVRAAAMSVRPYGRIVLMGGVGMLGGDDLALPYPWIMRNCVSMIGQWMFDRDSIAPLVALAKCGLLHLSQWEVTEFPLGQANEAVQHAAANGGPFKITVIRP